MPILNLKTTVQLSPSQAQEAMRQLVELSTQVLGKREVVTAFLHEVIPRANWWVGGRCDAVVQAQLDIRVTRGTNTEEEKSTFITQAYAVMERLFVGLDPVCYVSVLEVPSSDWGYGGLSQFKRNGQTN